MPDERRARPTPASDAHLGDRLDSWKEIAAYLGRGIRTVQRWEREEGLPVHRLAHDKRGSIYARREELAAWWESRRRTLAPPAPSEPMPAAAGPRLERITRTSAMTTWPALSSDARLAAYVSDAGQDGLTPQIWIQQIGGAALRLTSREHAYSHLSFSPDSTRIVFTATDEAGPNLYEVLALGGEPRLLQRGASCGQYSPDGEWLASVPRDGIGVRVAARDGAGFRTVAPELVDIACLTWLTDSRSVVVNARPNSSHDPDWWIVPIDGRPPTNTGLAVQLSREAHWFTVPTGVAWADNSLVFSAAGSQGVNLYRQRIDRSTLRPAGAAERLTGGSESTWLPAVAAGRLAFVSSQADANLWSAAVNRADGIAYGPVRRMTRGPGVAGWLSVTADGRTLAYFSFRFGQGDVFLRDLAAGVERIYSDAPPGPKAYPAISPSGRLLAYGTRVPGGERAARPIFIADLTDQTWRTLGDDCGGRPRAWVDERLLVIERFARLNSIALVDTATTEQRELLTSDERSIKNPRLSPDREWMAFDAARPGEPAAVFVCRFGERLIPQAEWIVVERSASHPFWSADGELLYYMPAGTNPIVRSAVRARRVTLAGLADGKPVEVFTSGDMMMPVYLPGTTAVATRDEIILVLGDFRGDVWLMDLDPSRSAAS